MNWRLAAIIILVLVSAGAGVSSSQMPHVTASRTSAQPYVTPDVPVHSMHPAGLAGQVWDAVWPSVSGIARYFETVTGVLLNDTAFWFSQIMWKWTASISGYGLWSFPMLAVLLGVTFIGVSLTLSAGDAARDVVEG